MYTTNGMIKKSVDLVLQLTRFCEITKFSTYRKYRTFKTYYEELL